MKAIGFKLVEVTNPNDGVITKKVRACFDNGEEFTFLTDYTLDEIKAKKSEILPLIIVGTGQYGKYAYISRAKTLEVI
jgi:hypothetical protein